jgi:hypothetical protein
MKFIKFSIFILTAILANLAFFGFVKAEDKTICCVYFEQSDSTFSKPLFAVQPQVSGAADATSCGQYGNYAVAVFGLNDEKCKIGMEKNKEFATPIIDKAAQSAKDAIKSVNETAKKASQNYDKNTALNIPDASALNELKTTDLKVVIGRALKTGLGIIGTITFVIFVFAGVVLMIGIQQGDSKGIEKGKDFLIWTIVGLAVIFASYAITDFLFEAFR